MDDWKYITSALCGVLLLVIILALVFNRGFRQDLVAGQGKATLLGFLSVEGVVVVLLCGMFLFGLLYPVVAEQNSPNEIERFLQRVPWQEQNLEGVAARIEKLSRENHEQREQIDRMEKREMELQTQVQDAQSKQKELINPEELPSTVRDLEPENPLSEELRKIAEKGEGPWSPYSSSKKILVSVPGGLGAASVFGCPEFFSRTLELTSAYRLGDTIIKGLSSITVQVNGEIFRARNCRDAIDYDLQLNCTDAVRLFSEEVLKCDGKNNPLWIVNERILPAYAVIVTNSRDTLSLSSHTP